MYSVRLEDAERTAIFEIHVERLFTLDRLRPLTVETIMAIAEALREKGWFFYADAFENVNSGMLKGTCLCIRDLLYYNYAKYTFRV